MQTEQGEHMLLSQIQQQHTFILKYQALEKKTSIRTTKKRKGKPLITNRVNKATSQYNGQIYFSSQIIMI